MLLSKVFKQSIKINATVNTVDSCITNLDLMRRWLNPALGCEAIGQWNTTIGSRSRFILKIPFVKPTLISTVVEREMGLVVWQFEGFFQGRDRWECKSILNNGNDRTELINTFEFKIPNPIVEWGFNNFASQWTKKDMISQLERIKNLAEEISKTGKL